jgi:alkanesulfonate monooxygenase SsuD/methylene tetrahydromethanopterin reductase-like flavin-dependent oxidoreductase (luciferase family)
VTFEGDFYSVDGVRLEPPVRRRPKFLIGGGSVERDGSQTVPRPIRERILEYGDGWLASGSIGPKATGKRSRDTSRRTAGIRRR